MPWEPPSRIKERAMKAIVNHLGGDSQLVRDAIIHITVEDQKVKDITLVGFAKLGLNEDELALIAELDKLAGKTQREDGNGTNVGYTEAQSAKLLEALQSTQEISR